MCFLELFNILICGVAEEGVVKEAEELIFGTGNEEVAARGRAGRCH